MSSTLNRKCQRCRKRDSGETAYCSICRPKHQKVIVARQERLMKEGLCTHCGLRPLVTKRHCAECRKKTNESSVRYYYRRKKWEDNEYENNSGLIIPK